VKGRPWDSTPFVTTWEGVMFTLTYGRGCCARAAGSRDKLAFSLLCFGWLLLLLLLLLLLGGLLS